MKQKSFFFSPVGGNEFHPYFSRDLSGQIIIFHQPGFP